MKLKRALQINEKMKQFIEISKTKPAFIDPEISTCPLMDLIESNRQADKYNQENKCKKYMVVGDVFLSALYLCLHTVPRQLNALDPIITVNNKTLYFYAKHGGYKEIVN